MFFRPSLAVCVCVGGGRDGWRDPVGPRAGPRVPLGPVRSGCRKRPKLALPAVPFWPAHCCWQIHWLVDSSLCVVNKNQGITDLCKHIFYNLSKLSKTRRPVLICTLVFWQTWRCVCVKFQVIVALLNCPALPSAHLSLCLQVKFGLTIQTRV